MAKLNSKSIGNNFERLFSKELSLWCSNGKDDDLFWRDLSSGARATVRAKQNKNSTNYGDIVATNLLYKPFIDLFFIDTKSYKLFNPIIINKKNIKSNSIFHQWIKVNNECPKDKIPFMVCKIRDSKTPQFIILPSSTKYLCSNKITYQIFFEMTYYVFDLIIQDEFFNLNSYDDLINMNQQEVVV